MSFSSPDIYFTQGYGQAVAAGELDHTWRLIAHVEGRWQLPILLRPLPSGRTDAISPYGYSGIYCSEDIQDPDRLWAKTCNELAELGVVSLFIRDSPLVPTYLPKTAQAVVDSHPTFFLPNLPEEEAWAQLEGRARTSIRKAIKSGLSVTMSKATGADLGPGGPFRDLYESTMRRVAAGSEYFFDSSYYSNLAAGLGDKLYISHTEKSGAIVAASLFMVGAAGMHYHLSGSTTEAAKLGASNLMLWEAWRFASATGLPGLHLGGGVRQGDSLEKFKKSFGGIEHRYSAYGVVIDEQQYAIEIDSAASVSGRLPLDLEKSGFFPAYRA